jgi:hypothetical protein
MLKESKLTKFVALVIFTVTFVGVLVAVRHHYQGKNDSKNEILHQVQRKVVNQKTVIVPGLIIKVKEFEISDFSPKPLTAMNKIKLEKCVEKGSYNFELQIYLNIPWRSEFNDEKSEVYEKFAQDCFTVSLEDFFDKHFDNINMFIQIDVNKMEKFGSGMLIECSARIIGRNKKINGEDLRELIDDNEDLFNEILKKSLKIR